LVIGLLGFGCQAETIATPLGPDTTWDALVSSDTPSAPAADVAPPPILDVLPTDTAANVADGAGLDDAELDDAKPDGAETVAPDLPVDVEPDPDRQRPWECFGDRVCTKGWAVVFEGGPQPPGEYGCDSESAPCPNGCPATPSYSNEYDCSFGSPLGGCILNLCAPPATCPTGSTYTSTLLEAAVAPALQALEDPVGCGCIGVPEATGGDSDAGDNSTAVKTFYWAYQTCEAAWLQVIDLTQPNTPIARELLVVPTAEGCVLRVFTDWSQAEVSGAPKIVEQECSGLAAATTLGPTPTDCMPESAGF